MEYTMLRGNTETAMIKAVSTLRTKLKALSFILNAQNAIPRHSANRNAIRYPQSNTHTTVPTAIRIAMAAYLMTDH